MSNFGNKVYVGNKAYVEGIGFTTDIPNLRAQPFPNIKDEVENEIKYEVLDLLKAQHEDRGYEKALEEYLSYLIDCGSLDDTNKDLIQRAAKALQKRHTSRYKKKSDEFGERYIACMDSHAIKKRGGRLN